LEPIVTDYQSPGVTRERLREDFLRIRHASEHQCRPLAIDDYQLQSMAEASPPKWHLGHVTWFFESFLLQSFAPGYTPFHPRFGYLFNSYYQTVGTMQPRPQRGLLSRPTVEQVYEYRAQVDQAMVELIERCSEHDWPEVRSRIALGLNHEQQHQELFFMDLKHHFWANPLLPAYRDDLPIIPTADARPLGWVEGEEGLVEIGHSGNGFSYDNERAQHKTFLTPHRLADRLITNEEYLEFMQDGGYDQVEIWLSDGWDLIRRSGWRHPLYWYQEDGQWREFTLGGSRPLNLAAPVSHVSYFEADAFARWAGKRLPREEELERQLALRAPEGNFHDVGLLHPRPGTGQWYGDLWEWTCSPYTAYPGFRPPGGAIGEYNGKFMCNQMVLRGACCVTPREHMRATYRNFFYPHERWVFSGIRLAADVS